MVRQLEIAIPTFNRSVQLHRLLSSILLQSNATCLESISVAIYDNSDIADMVAIALLDQLKAAGCSTSYTKNITNIGAVANIAQAYARSSGKWSIVVGDDDYFMPYSLDRIVDYTFCAEKNNVGLFQYGFICIDDDLCVKFVHPRSHLGNRLFSPSDLIASEGSIHDLSFISSVVVRSSIWNSDVHIKYNKPTQLYAHVFCLLDGLRTANLDAMRIDEHLVFSGDGRNEYYSSKVAVSRLSEFAEYDRIAFNHSPATRRQKLQEYRYNWYRRFRLDVVAALKIAVFRDSYYRSHLHLLQTPLTPYLPSYILCKAIYYLTSVHFLRVLLARFYFRHSRGKDLADVDAIV